MKSHFPGFYQPSRNEFADLWRSCIFVLDANVLLNLYRYPATARDELINVLARVENRLWTPYQAALEYQRNRVLVLAEQKKRFKEVRDVVVNVVSNLETEFAKLKLKDRHSLINPDGFVGSIRSSVDQYQLELDKLEKDQGNVNGDDPIRDRIDRLLNGRVGSKPTQTFLDEIYKSGEERYRFKVPPGYLDEKKSSNESNSYFYNGCRYQGNYGDLIIWHQIMAFCKSSDKKTQLYF